MMAISTESSTGDNSSESLTRSRQRIADHGEVFTPIRIVEDMLDLVKSESERIDSRFLEPACGSGNFLRAVLTRKLDTVESKYGKSIFEKRHHALFALMCIYGLELLTDNLKECRENLLEIYSDFLDLSKGDVWLNAAEEVLRANVLQGDALTLTNAIGEHLVFPEWGYLGAGRFQRRDFRFDALTQRAAIKGTLFELFEEQQLFVPIKTYPQMSVDEIAQ